MANTFTPLKTSAFIVGDKWGQPRAELARQSLYALCFRVIDLGGTRKGGVEGTGAQNADEYKDIVLPGADLQGFTIQARVQVMTDAAGTTVQPKIRDITSSSDLAAGTASASLTWVEEVIAITLPAFTRTYRLQLVKSNATALVYGVGMIEVLAP